MDPLTCEDFATLLGDYVEDLLPSERRVAADEHARTCKPCRELFEQYRGTPALVRRVTRVEMPLGAQARLRRLLSRIWRSRS